MMNLPRVCIVILNWNGLEDTIECIESLRNISYPNYEVIVVDNASTGNDVVVLKGKYKDYCYFIENKENYGYGKGFAIGMKTAFDRGAKYVALLHNDTIVSPDFLNHLVIVAENHSNYGILSPVSYYYDQPEQIQHGGETARWFGLRAVEVMNSYRGNEVLECLWVPLNCLFLEREKSALMNITDAMEDYFLYGDPIWFLCALKNKLKIGCVPLSRIWHKGSKSLKRAGPTRMRWIVRDNLVLRFRFITSGYFQLIPLRYFIFFASWMYFYRPFSFVKLLFRSLNFETINGILIGVKDGFVQILKINNKMKK